MLAYIWRPGLCLLLLEVLIRHLIAGEDWYALLLPACFYTVVYLVIFLVAARFSLMWLTLCYLGLPYVLFAIGWLHWLLATVFLLVLVWSMLRVGMLSKLEENGAVHIQTYLVGISLCAAFLLIVFWLHLSGSGGNGFQNIDYIAHNGRLKELIDYAWPVRYGDGRALVFYVGYYLPAAAVGKWLGLSVAYSFLYFWTLAGVWLAFLWLARLSSARYLVIAALMLMLFGGWDAAHYLFQTWNIPGQSVAGIFSVANFRVDFWAAELLGFNVGAYLSNTFQLYWAPHQIVAGWLVASLLLTLYTQGQYRVMGVVYALCALWAPLLLLALFPLMLLLCISEGKKSICLSMSPENIIGGGVIALLFGFYYLGGGALNNPSGFLWQFVSVRENLIVLFCFFMLSWGIYAAVCFPLVFSGGGRGLRFYIALLLTLSILPWCWYGEWADLMCRGSAPLMFLLLVFCMRSSVQLAKTGRYVVAVFLLLFLPGSISALRLMQQSMNDYHYNLPFDLRSIDSSTSSEYVGSDQSFFFRYLAR